MLLEEICTPDVICCGPETTVQAAATLMRSKHIGDLVVVDDPQESRIPLGVVTDRDIVVEVIANGLDPAVTALKSLLRSPVVIAHGHEDASTAVERMRAHGIRRLPIVGNGGQLCGIITLDDLLRLVAADVAALVALVGREDDRERRSRR